MEGWPAHELVMRPSRRDSVEARPRPRAIMAVGSSRRFDMIDEITLPKLTEIVC
jgi:hypothetical protein